MPQLETNNINLYYETHGQGDPLLLIAGLASDSQSWLTIMDALSSRYLVIAPDNRGSGRTQSLDMDVTIPLIAEDCLALIRHLGLSRVNVLGHSMGGIIATELAKKHPDCVNKLALASTPYYVSNRIKSMLLNLSDCLSSGLEAAMWFQNFFHWLFTEGFFNKTTVLSESIRYAIEYPYPQSPSSFAKQVRAIADYPYPEDLYKITAKTIVICGREDLMFPPKVCKPLSKVIENIEFCIINKAAHAIHIEQPQRFVNRVIEFFA